MKKYLISILIIIITLSGCSINKLSLFKEVSFDVGFNTPFQVMLFTKDQDEFDEYFEMMKEEIIYLNSLFDIYNNYEGVNNIKTINDNAGIKAVEVDQLIIDLLLESKELSEKTQHLFNPTLGSVLKIWHDAREIGMELNRQNKYGKSPKLEVLEAANVYVGWEYIEINEEAKTVYINNENAALDVGAIAKGWAVEKVARIYEDKGIEFGIVNGGGNVRLIGSKNKDKWSVGISNPDSIQDESLMSLLFDKSMSVVTSGDYERYFIDEDLNHQHHLINPKTLQPTNISRSVTITTLDSGLADALSTAFAMINLKEAEELYKKLNIEDLGIVYVFDEVQDYPDFFNYEEVKGKHLYYNDVIVSYKK